MRTIVLTRPQPVRDDVTSVLRAHGMRVLGLPTLHVAAHVDADFEQHLLTHWASYQGVMLVSQHAVNFAAQRLHALGLVWREQVWAAAVGRTTADAAHHQWPNASLVFPATHESQDSEGLWQALQRAQANLMGQRILIVRAQMGRDVFLNHLRAAGAVVDVWPCYRREPLMWSVAQCHDFKQALRGQGVVLSITSQEGMLALLDNLVALSDDDRQFVFAQPVLTLHPSIAECARSHGFNHVHIAPAKNTAEHLQRLAQVAHHH
ncbi:Uroporphyrinogen-III synthase [Ephemeroptericola cinctiostellae]|uniref:Uroporphyrinogen-III synthase n=1 Tax=Ephemeroptericola cinctiostellae TaxID=2268024 RepID=A0A345D9L9_9BURK|nr:uroporphyrinogen-III synthase [Ephemeroptericola cinctiostellae]AXF85057.1 Uroporphyrinogen-III synthase [Ephemeroptericola cinctiostellae]